jgi:rare lipoprotein A
MMRASLRLIGLIALLALGACTSPRVTAPGAPIFSQTGIASWYGRTHQGRITASGERFDMNRMTAAHKTLELGTVVRVTNLETGDQVKVRINDRGPYVSGRVIDLSAKAASDLGIKEDGIARVRIEAFAADQEGARTAVK